MGQKQGCRTCGVRWSGGDNCACRSVLGAAVVLVKGEARWVTDIHWCLALPTHPPPARPACSALAPTNVYPVLLYGSSTNTCARATPGARAASCTCDPDRYFALPSLRRRHQAAAQRRRQDADGTEGNRQQEASSTRCGNPLDPEADPHYLALDLRGQAVSKTLVTCVSPPWVAPNVCLRLATQPAPSSHRQGADDVLPLTLGDVHVHPCTGGVRKEASSIATELLRSRSRSRGNSNNSQVVRQRPTAWAWPR